MSYESGPRSFTSLTSAQIASTRPLVTSTTAQGWRVDANRDSHVTYGVSITATLGITALLSGSVSGTVLLEIAATNSTTASDWTEIARFTNAQSAALSITLVLTQKLEGIVSGMIPRGYYARLRTVNGTTSGTGSVAPTYAVLSAQEVLE